ncbi:MAG: hypothetical protein KDB26_08900 [Microthrixaceae bacterium]|nr:hypothetical protein [Microthrixaceae bacterium]
MDSTGTIARRYKLTTPAVWMAINQGRLKATSVHIGTRNYHLIDPQDAEKLWGHRLQKAS